MPHSLQGENETDWSKPGRFTTSSINPDTRAFGDWGKQGANLPSMPLCLDKQKQLWFCLTSHWANRPPDGGCLFWQSQGFWWPRGYLPPLSFAAKRGAYLSHRSGCRDTQDLTVSSPQTLNTGELRQVRAPFTHSLERGEHFHTAVQVSSDASASGGANFSTAIIKPVGFSAFLSLDLVFSDICLNSWSMKFYTYM